MNSNKRILVINTNKFDRNGMSTVVMNYYEYMDRTGITFDFVSNEYMDPEFKSYILNHGDRVFLFKNRKSNPIAYVWKLRRIIANNNYDVIHIHGNSSTVAAEISAIKLSHCKSKIVLHAHGVTTNHPVIHRILVKYVNKNIDIALAASKSAGNFLFKNFNKFEVVKNGIDIDKFKFNLNDRKIIRGRLGLKEDEKLLLHVGAFNGAKNQTLLVKMFQELTKVDSKYKLVFIGDGGLRHKVELKVNKMGLQHRILFLGEINDVEKFYSAADVFLFPSKYEPFGIVALEAQANGLPCLVSTKLPMTVKLTNNIKFLPIYESDIKKWIDSINDAHRITNINVSNWNHKGYNIRSVAKKIKEIYLNA